METSSKKPQPIRTRQMVRLIRRICRESGIEMTTYSDDWILRLRAGGRTMYIYGYKFPNNNAAVEQLCDDKAALSAVLESAGIPHVEHLFYQSPLLGPLGGAPGCLLEILEQFERYGGAAVCKTNTGTGGNNVFAVRSRRELEEAVFTIFRTSRAMSMSPLVDIQNEYRTIISDGKVQVVYRKLRPAVIGNGRDSLRVLIAKAKFGDEVHIMEELDQERVPAADKRVEVSWKHNLGQGSMPELLPDGPLRAELARMAQDCAATLGIAFASVDIVRDGGDGALKVLEINSGVMMEKFSAFCPEYEAIATGIYRTAIFRYLGMGARACNLRTGPARASLLPALLDTARAAEDLEVDESSGRLPYIRIARPDGRALLCTGKQLSCNPAGALQLARNHEATMDLLQQLGFAVGEERTGKIGRDGSPDVDLSAPLSLPGGGYPVWLQPIRALRYEEDRVLLADQAGAREALSELDPGVGFRLRAFPAGEVYGAVLYGGQLLSLRRKHTDGLVQRLSPDQAPAGLAEHAARVLRALGLHYGEVDLTAGGVVFGVDPEPSPVEGEESTLAGALLQAFRAE